MIVVELLLCLLLLAILVPVLVVLVQVLMALPANRKKEMSGRRPSLVVAMPAHNEALLIVDTLRAISQQLAPGDRLLVVADNCTDDTAAIAVAAGAEVIERNDREHCGKGYALDFAIRHLKRNPPEVVIVIDADCHVESGAIERLSRLCLASGRPAQALYAMRSPVDAGIKTRIAEFSWVVKTHVRPLGYHRAGLPCQLMGTGMAFPWIGIDTAPLASGHIVEDLMLGIDLTRAGLPPLFCPDAEVTSVFPSSANGLQTQRTRWEHGHLGAILSEAPQMLLQAVRRRDVNLFALALDLSVPPLALLLLAVLIVFIACVVFFLVTSRALPLWLASATLALLGSAVLLAWGRYARHILSFRSLAYAPFYALWKIPLYLKFLAHRQIEWIRSERNGN